MPKSSNNKDIAGEGKICAILSYLLIGIIWYFADDKMKKNEFAKYHVKQGLVILIVSLAGSIALGMTFILAWLIPFFQLAIFVLIVIGIINASNRQKKELPIVGKFGKMFKF